MNQDSDNTIRLVRRNKLRDYLQEADKQSLDTRVDRYLEINYKGMIGGHHFAAASTECIELYRDGHFISAVMSTQAVNDGLLKFLAERNDIKTKSHDELMKQLVSKDIISDECATASEKIWQSFRNDVHHMNPKVLPMCPV